MRSNAAVKAMLKGVELGRSQWVVSLLFSLSSDETLNRLYVKLCSFASS